MKAGEGLYRSPLAEVVLIKCQLPIITFLRLSTNGRYSVTNGKIRMRVFCLFCRVDVLSLSLISERVRLQFMFSWPEQRATPT